MGVNIYVYRTKIVITGYDKPKNTPGYLPNIFCVWDTKAKRYIKFMRYSHLLDNGDIIVPRTCDLRKIIDRLRSQDVTIDGIYNEPDTDVIPYKYLSRPVHLNSDIKPKNEFQEEAIKFLTDPHYRDDIHFRLLSLPTGEGKTVCAMFAISILNRKTLIVVNSLMDQWVKELFSKIDVSYKKLYEIRGMDSVYKLMEKERCDKYDIYLASLKTLMLSQEENLYEPLMRKIGIGLKIIDEIHLQSYSNIYLDMCANISDTIYLSATPNRSNSSENYTFTQIMKNCPSFGSIMLDYRRKYLNCIYVMYDTHPKYYEVKECNTFRGFHCGNFAKHIFNEKNAHIILDIINWAVSVSLENIDESEKIAIILEHLSDVQKVKNYLEEKFPNLTIGEYTSNISKDEKKYSLENQVILSTEDSFGTGADMRGKLRVLINVTTYASKVTAQQLPGRLRDIPGKNVYYIDLVNLGFKRTYEHYLTRSKIINKYAASVKIRKYGRDI